MKTKIVGISSLREHNATTLRMLREVQILTKGNRPLAVVVPYSQWAKVLEYFQEGQMKSKASVVADLLERLHESDRMPTRYVEQWIRENIDGEEL